MEQDLQSALFLTSGRQVADLKLIMNREKTPSGDEGMLPPKTGSLTKRLVIEANFCIIK